VGYQAPPVEPPPARDRPSPPRHVPGDPDAADDPTEVFDRPPGLGHGAAPPPYAQALPYAPSTFAAMRPAAQPGVLGPASGPSSGAPIGLATAPPAAAPPVAVSPVAVSPAAV